MKTKSLFLIAIAGFMFSFMLTSCTQDNPGNISQTKVINVAKKGTWKITYFDDSGKDETNHFTGYTFEFDDNNVLTASNGTNNYSGTWSIIDSNSNDDSQDDLHFNIQFNLSNDFEDLNDDWNFISQSDNKIELIDVSGGNGGTDYLTFEKN